MKQFNHIVIHKDNASLMKLMEKMMALEGEDFSYDKEASDRVNAAAARDSTCKGTYYALFSSKEESLYYATVFMSVKDDELKVFNINSSDHRYSDLGITRFNFVMNSFFHHFMARCLDESFADCISISGEVRSLKDDLGDEVYKALKAWESICNKEHPTSHPMDEQLWFDFICKLYESGKSLHPSEFAQWLCEDCNWPPYYNNAVAETAEKLEYSLSLLNYYGRFGNN